MTPNKYSSLAIKHGLKMSVKIQFFRLKWKERVNKGEL